MAKPHEPKPGPSCPMGFTETDLQARLGGRYDAFVRWMAGQTMALCDGCRYDYDAHDYVPTACADSPHGVVCYRGDVERFERGRPALDW